MFDKYKDRDLSNAMSQILSHGTLDNFIKENNLADESLIKFLKDTNYATKDLANYQQYLKNTGNKISNFSAFTNKAGSILKSFGTSLASIGVNMAIGMGIEALFSAIDQAANRVEYAKQRADEFTNVAKSQKEEFNQNTSKIAELNEQYQTLSKGVNNAGENISLTTEEYKTYKDVVSQISNIIPDLNTYYNDQGEKIGFVTGELKNLNKEYDKYKMKEALKTINGEGEDGVSLSDVIDNFNAQKDTDGWSDFVNAPKSFITGNDYDDLYSNEDLLTSLKELKNLSKDDVADKLGYARSTYLDFLAKFLSGGTEGGPDGKTTDKMRALQDILGYNKSDFEDMNEEEYGAFQDKLDAVIQSYEGKLDTATDGLSEGLQKVAASRPEYYALGDKKQYVDTLLSNITYGMADNIGLTDEDGKMTEESVRVFVNRMIESVKDNKSGINTAFQSLFKLDTDSMNPLEAKEKVDTYINQIASVLYGDKVNSNQINGLKLLYGFGDVADDATTYSSKLKNFYSKDNNSNSQETIENWSQNSNVTDEELESLKDKGYSAKSSIDELNIALNKLRNDSKKELVPKDFSTVWDSLDSDSKDTLLGTADSCELTGDKIKALAKDNKNLDAAFKASGMSADEFARSVREANIDNLDNDIDVYEDALQKMRDGKSLSAEETAVIISKDNSLANSVKKTKDGYIIEESALLSVINASKEKYNVVAANEILQTETIIKNTKNQKHRRK